MGVWDDDREYTRAERDEYPNPGRCPSCGLNTLWTNFREVDSLAEPHTGTYQTTTRVCRNPSGCPGA
jgi:hypothetical protein